MEAFGSVRNLLREFGCERAVYRGLASRVGYGFYIYFAFRIVSYRVVFFGLRVVFGSAVIGRSGAAYDQYV